MATSVKRQAHANHRGNGAASLAMPLKHSRDLWVILGSKVDAYGAWVQDSWLLASRLVAEQQKAAQTSHS